ncbi:hypothetical protein GOBAR_DD07083 [Gossypium barbadense]|nr:hypothetical protein GOBAR_DD07083 [Gossypium barbadense]
MVKEHWCKGKMKGKGKEVKKENNIKESEGEDMDGDKRKWSKWAALMVQGGEEGGGGGRGEDISQKKEGKLRGTNEMDDTKRRRKEKMERK